MYVAGIDIGTTSICCLTADAEAGGKATVLARPNDAGLPSVHGWDRTQNPERIVALVEALIAEQKQLGNWEKVAAIGISCQMHGILYVDGQGHAVSPLYTWQDRRGDRLMEPSARQEPGDSAGAAGATRGAGGTARLAEGGAAWGAGGTARLAEGSAALPAGDAVSYAAYMSEAAGCKLAAGYGLVTHYYNMRNGLIPPGAVYLCTIGDYVAMKLCGRRVPLMDASNAASLGMYDPAARRFDLARIEALGMRPQMLPPLAEEGEVAGTTPEGKTVACAIGDNQASFLGSVPSLERSMLVNIGTGAQISIFSEQPEAPAPLEARPFPGGGWLLVGASLGGGKTYALLEALFRDIHDSFADKPLAPAASLYERMNELAEDALRQGGEPLRVTAAFFGTRHEPGRAGAIAGITDRNWTAGHLALGFLDGIADELLAFADAFPAQARSRVQAVAASGNGIRRNRAMRRLLESKLGRPLHLSPVEEEAALGAAIYAAVCGGIWPDLDAAIACLRKE